MKTNSNTSKYLLPFLCLLLGCQSNSLTAPAKGLGSDSGPRLLAFNQGLYKPGQLVNTSLDILHDPPTQWTVSTAVVAESVSFSSADRFQLKAYLTLLGATPSLLTEDNLTAFVRKTKVKTLSLRFTDGEVRRLQLDQFNELPQGSFLQGYNPAYTKHLLHAYAENAGLRLISTVMTASELEVISGLDASAAVVARNLFEIDGAWTSGSTNKIKGAAGQKIPVAVQFAPKEFIPRPAPVVEALEKLTFTVPGRIDLNMQEVKQIGDFATRPERFPFVCGVTAKFVNEVTDGMRQVYLEYDAHFFESQYGAGIHIGGPQRRAVGNAFPAHYVWETQPNAAKNHVFDNGKPQALVRLFADHSVKGDPLVSAWQIYFRQPCYIDFHDVRVVVYTDRLKPLTSPK